MVNLVTDAFKSFEVASKGRRIVSLKYGYVINW